MTEQQGVYSYHLTAKEMDAESVSLPPTSLSPRCADILRFLHEYTAAHNGMSPTMRKIGDAVGISSTSVTKYNLNILKERGYITFGGAGRQRHIGIVGARYINPPLPREAKRVLGYGDEVTDPTLLSPDEARSLLGSIQKWRVPIPFDDPRLAAVDEAIREAIMRAERQLAQRIEDQILGDRDGR